MHSFWKSQQIIITEYWNRSQQVAAPSRDRRTSAAGLLFGRWRERNSGLPTEYSWLQTTPYSTLTAGRLIMAVAPERCDRDRFCTRTQRQGRRQADEPVSRREGRYLTFTHSSATHAASSQPRATHELLKFMLLSLWRELLLAAPSTLKSTVSIFVCVRIVFKTKAVVTIMIGLIEL